MISSCSKLRLGRFFFTDALDPFGRENCDRSSLFDVETRLPSFTGFYLVFFLNKMISSRSELDSVALFVQ